MSVVSSVSHKKSWQTRRERVSVLAELALRKENVVRRLIALREQHGLTQEGAAHRVGVTSRQWQRWESGDSMPYPRNLDQIASKFGISVADFFDADDPEPLDDQTPGESQLDRIERRQNELYEKVNALTQLLDEFPNRVLALARQALRDDAGTPEPEPGTPATSGTQARD